MSGEKTNPAEIPPEEKARFERLDFDNTFTLVQNSLNPALQESIAEKIGISELIIGYDSSGETLADDVAYEDTLEYVPLSRDGENNRVLMLVRPGGAAIERYWGALDLYTEEDYFELRSTARSTAHEMYACNLLVNAHMLAARKEISAQGEFPLIQSTLETISMMLQSENARAAIRDSDFEKKEQLLRLIDPISSDPNRIMALNMHRLAAGVFFYIYKKGEPRIYDGITYAMREEISTDLIKDEMDDDTFMKHLGLYMPRPDEISKIEEMGAEIDVVMNYEKLNTIRAEKIDIDMLGWAFPMSPKEVALILKRFKNQ